MREQNLTKGDGKNYLIVTERYFNAFKEKNLDILSGLYSNSVELTDWTGAWYGKESVLEANKQLFENEFDLNVNSSLQLENITYNKYFIHSELIRYAEKLIENNLNEVQALMLSNLSDNVVFILKKENIYITLEKAMEYFLDIEEYEQCATIRDLLILMENKNEKRDFKTGRRNQRKSKAD